MNENDELKDEVIHQSLSLFRFTAAQAAAIAKRLKAMQAQLVKLLSNELTSDATKAEAKTIIANSEKIITDYYGGIQGEFDFGDLGETIAKKTSSSLEIILGVDAIAMPTQAYFDSLQSNILIEGAPSADWWAAQSDKTAFNFAAQLRQGLANGETNQQIVSRIVGKNGLPGIMDVAKRDAQSLVHASVQTIANDARLNVFRKNSDVIAGVRQISTLDSHTTLICIAYSDACWNLEGNPIRGTVLPFNGGPPRHWGCRSVLAPITKTFAELGIKASEPAATTRASDEGQISAKTDFDNFLKRKGTKYQDEMLGKGRADLWRAGKITLRDLVNGQGRPLTTAELKAKFGQ